MDPDHPSPPWWAALVVALPAAVWWFVVARWLFVHAGHFHASWDSTGCRSGAPDWANQQAIVALGGLVATAAALGLLVRFRRPFTRATKVAGALALCCLIAWLVLVFGYDPRRDLGIYAGCGQG